MNDGEKREVAVELSVPHAEEEETVNKQSTTILEQVSDYKFSHYILVIIRDVQIGYWEKSSEQQA